MCPQLECLPCGQGRGCAPGQPLVEGTCCVEGDPLLHLARGSGSEVVSIEAQGDWVVTCGGFGASIENVSDPADPVVVGGATPRCQNMAFGRVFEDGSQAMYFAHHGDTWVATPFLATYRVKSDGVAEVETQGDPEVLFEGMAWHDDWLYVAAHTQGVRVYRTGARDGTPTLHTVVGGFDNALRPTVDMGGPGDTPMLYVADGAGGLHVLSLLDPGDPQPVAALDLPGIVRDVVVRDGEAYLAKGGDGVDIIDVSDPSAPVVRGHIETSGTAQAVDVGDDIVAIAAWSHVAIHDRSTGQLLATERVDHSPSFEQDTAVALRGNYVHVGEWEDHHVLQFRPGYVAPDLWVEDDLLSFGATESDDRVVVVRNRGYLDLFVESIEVGPSFDVDASWLQVPPGSGRALEVSYEPPAPDGGQSVLVLHNSDPDASQDPTELPLIARDSEHLLNVGDAITEDFAFLDPTGSPDLAGLEGKVIVLAYFALF